MSDESEWNPPYEQLELEGLFMEGVEAMQKGETSRAEESFRAVLLKDPRLPEPRLELAMILFRRDDMEEAEEQARFALEQIEKGWHWLDVMTDEELHAHALTLVAEILVARTSGDGVEVVDGEVLRETWTEAERMLRRAVQLDPHNGDALRGLAGFKARRSS